jgi:hypothetical protein
MDYLKNFLKAAGFALILGAAACGGKSDSVPYEGFTDKYKFTITNSSLYKGGQKTGTRMNRFQLKPRDNTSEFTSIVMDDFDGNRQFSEGDWIYAISRDSNMGCGYGNSQGRTFIPCQGPKLENMFDAVNDAAKAPAKRW